MSEYGIRREFAALFLVCGFAIGAASVAASQSQESSDPTPITQAELDALRDDIERDVRAEIGSEICADIAAQDDSDPVSVESVPTSTTTTVLIHPPMPPDCEIIPLIEPTHVGPPAGINQ